METEQLHKERKIFCNIFFVIFITFILFVAGSVLGAIISGIAAGAFRVADQHLWIVVLYLPFIGISLLTLLYTFCTRRDIFKLYFRGSQGNNMKMIGLGLLTGFAMNCLCIGVAALHGDVRFEAGQIPAVWLLIAFVVVFIQSATEELLVRGYVFYHIRFRYGAVLALVVSSVGFSLMHASNNGVTLLALVNIALIGLFYAFCVHYLDSLWFSMANHAAWNFTQNFIFGLPNSGMASQESILKLSLAENSVFYNVDFGIESTITASVVTLCGVIAVYLIGKKWGKPQTH